MLDEPKILQKDCMRSFTQHYYNQTMQLLVMKCIFIAKSFENQTGTRVKVFKVMPEDFVNDLSYYMCNYIMAKVNSITLILINVPNSNSFFQQKLYDQDQQTYYLHEILGITNKRSIVLNILIYDKQINFEQVQQGTIEISDLILDCHSRILAIDQSEDIFGMDNELNILVEKLKNKCTLLKKKI